MRPFDVQLMGAIVLHQGKIAEMKTGEGKTLVGPLAAALNAMSGRGVHVVTVNDYLAKRDPQWMGPIYHGLGLSVGIVQHDTAFLFDPDYRPSDERLLHLRPVARGEAYAADVTYATNNELGFDYLRDNMVQDLAERVQRDRYFAIVDEVDNILIDEARTPLIISGQAEESEDLYYTFARLVPRLEARPENAEEGGDYFVDLKEHAVSPTEEGIDKIEQLLGIRDLYDVATDPRLPRHFEQALRAHALYKRDRDYIVKDGEIVIVDEFTGRQMPGRRWSEGLHQAVEAKEGLRVQRESVTLATITFQNYFRLYEKLVGHDRHGHDRAGGVLQDLRPRGGGHPHPPAHGPRGPRRTSSSATRTPSSRPSSTRSRSMPEAGRPILVGTVSVEKSEMLAEHAQASRHPPRGPQRQVPREGSARSWRRPAAVARSPSPPTWPAAARTSSWAATRRPGLAEAPQAGPQPGGGGAGRSTTPRWPRRQAEMRRRARRGRRRGRAAHHRHRAPRRAPHRQPAARPRRPPGRPRLVALLPVPRGHADEALRERPRHRAHGAHGPRG